MNNFYTSKNFVLFGIGSMIAGKILAAFAEAQEIIENGGSCNITFKFDKDSISGIVRYSSPRVSSKVVKFDDVYQLVSVLTNAKQELS